MTDALLLGVLALIATVVAGYPAISLLRRFNVGKEISEWGPESHQAKAGTPTMGGLLVVAVIAAVTLLFNLYERGSMLAPLGILALLAALGFVDDLGSLQGRPKQALTRRVKLVAFIGIGAIAAWGLYDQLDLSSLNVPWEGRTDLGIAYLAIVMLVVVLAAGGVAVTDGLDGLLAGTMAAAYGAYGLIALSQEQTYLGAFCFTVSGALVGFLWHNAYPAQVFIGDTGALPLGGCLAIVAFMTGHWLLLPIIGIIFVIEGLSVGLQVGYFRVTGGKRILLMAPLHHHFEKLGWHEVQVVQRFWAVGAVGGALGIVLAMEV
jgi:phospho-N-acetylmuramoyl-pentapeptide-transferase